VTDRRTFNRNVALALVALATTARAQQKTKTPRIGILSPIAPLSPPSPNHEAFRQALRELIYVEGRTIEIDFRSADGKLERLPVLAAELVRLKVDAIVTNSEGAIRAAKDATTIIPIIMAVTGDPVETGLIASLARPGENITGLTNLASGLNRKRLELLKEVVAPATRIAVLRYPGEPVRSVVEWNDAQAAAATLGLSLQSVEV